MSEYIRLKENYGSKSSILGNRVLIDGKRVKLEVVKGAWIKIDERTRQMDRLEMYLDFTDKVPEGDKIIKATKEPEKKTKVEEKKTDKKTGDVKGKKEDLKKALNNKKNTGSKK